MSQPYRVQFVCTGNICRSPMGEVILRDMVEDEGLGDLVVVDSAGLDPWHAGDPADPRTVAALARAGYNGRAHRAKVVDPRELAQRDLVLAADRGHLDELRGLLLRTPGRTQLALIRTYDPEALGDEVDDPYFGDDEGFDRCRDEIEAACRGLVEELHQLVGE